MQNKVEGQQINIPFKCIVIHFRFYKSFKISLETYRYKTYRKYTIKKKKLITFNLRAVGCLVDLANINVILGRFLSVELDFT